MLPFFTIFGKTIPLYGLCTVVGVLLALGLILLCCPRFALNRENGVYLFVMGAVGAAIGAKALYLLTVLPELVRDLPLLWQAPGTFLARYISGGMVFYGGLAGAFLGAYWSARSYGVRLRDYYPVLLPALAITAGFGRIGCFCAGCCYGVGWKHGIVLQAYAPNVPGDVPRVPVQLLEAGFDFLLAAALYVLACRTARRERLLETYLLAYCPMRFVLEFLRGDGIRGILFGLSVSQWLSLLALLALGCFRLHRRKQKTE